AIYGWRGADVRHMLSFQHDFPGATLIKLEQNYRSTQVILDAANGVIAENARRLGKTLFTAKQGGEPVTLLTAADERDEAEWLADAPLAPLVRAATQWRQSLLQTAGAAGRIPDLRPNVRDAFLGLAHLLEDLRARYGQADPATALEQAIAAVGYPQYLAEEGPEGIERLENVQELIAGAAAWAETATDDGDEAGDEAGEGGSETGSTLIERYLTQAALVT